MIAVTGGLGFIGSNLARTLADAGADLLIVDHPATAVKLPNLTGLKKYHFIEHDAFIHNLSSHRYSPEVIYHLGACSATTELNWDYLHQNNVVYSQHLWNWCTANQRTFIYASSAATYGNGSSGYDDRISPERLAPLNLYGKSKNDFDQWALSQQTQPPRWAGLKFFNVYGPREAHKQRMASVAYQAWNQIRDHGCVRLFKSHDPHYGDGGQLRDFVFVRDCVKHMIWLAQYDHPGGLYNSGTGQARSFNDLATAVFTAMNIPAQIDYIPMPGDLEKQYQNFTQAEMTKLRSIGCTIPATALEAGVRDYIQWLNSTTTSKMA